MFDKLEVNEGMLVENIVAQMLRAAGHKLYFFSNSSRTSADDRM
ncbi:MAG: ATPase, partial [bacterium]|nr:ATPase [Candidatus Aphodosoma intestinipullorum]